MDGVFDLLKIPDNDVRTKTLQALHIIVNDNFSYMHLYLQYFYHMLESFISLENAEDITRSCIEIWCTIFDKEIELREQENFQLKDSIILKYDWTNLSDLLLRGL